jgi:hypothetical protein
MRLIAFICAASMAVLLAVSGFGQVKRQAKLPSGAAIAMESFSSEVHEIDATLRAKVEKLIDGHVKKMNETSQSFPFRDKNAVDDAASSIRSSLELLPRGNADKIRKALEGSLWSWKKHSLELHPDGKVTASWKNPQKTGNWYVDPDGTVVWYCADISVIHLMQLSADMSRYQIRYAGGELGVSGARIR